MPDRKHRTSEQMITDLEAKIASIRRHAERRRARQNPAVRHTIQAVKLLDKAMAATSDTTMRGALHEARATLSACVAVEGVVLPASSTTTAVPSRRARGPVGAFQAQ